MSASTPRYRIDALLMTGALDSPELASLDEQEACASCGWYDSSHELQQGLQVTELVLDGEGANDWPLSWWLGWVSAAPKRPR